MRSFLKLLNQLSVGAPAQELPLRLIEQVMWQAVRRSWKGPPAYRQCLDYPAESGENLRVSGWISYRF
jgi:hypothetical protein